MRHRPDDDEDEPYVVIERRGSGATSFLVGLAVGAGIALLFAPQSGEETRRQLKRRARRAANVARDAAGDLSENMVDRYEQAKRTVEDRLGASGPRDSQAPGSGGVSRRSRGRSAGAAGPRGAHRAIQGQLSRGDQSAEGGTPVHHRA